MVESASARLHLTVAILGQGRLAADGEWALNEKRIIDRAGLGRAAAIVEEHHGSAISATAAIARMLELPRWA